MSSGPESPDQTEQPPEAAEPAADDRAADDLADRAERPSLNTETEQQSQLADPVAAGSEPLQTDQLMDWSRYDSLEGRDLADLAERVSLTTQTESPDQLMDRSSDSSPAVRELADLAERPSLTTETARESKQAPVDAQGQRSEAPADQQSSERPVAFTDQPSARSEGPGTPRELTPRQREQLQQYGINPDGVASAHADRVTSALTNAGLAWNASRGDASAADQLRARGVSAKVESGGAPGTGSPTESHLVQATDANTSLRIESILDRATGVITRNLRFRSTDGYVLDGSQSEQVEPAVVGDERVASGPGDQATQAAGLEQQPRTGERAHQESSDGQDANQVDRPSATSPEREAKDRWADGLRVAQVFGRLPEGAQEAAKASSRGSSESRGRRSEVSEIADFVRDQFGRSGPERLLGGVVAGIAKQVFEPVGWVRDAAILGYRAGEAWVTGSTALDLSNFQPSSDLTRSLIERERSGEEVGSAQAASEFVVAGITAPIQVPYEFGRALAGGDLAEIGEQSVNMLLLLASMRGGEGRGLRAGPEAPVQRVPSGQGVAPDAPTYRLFREKVTTGGEVESLAAGSEAQRHGTPMSQPAEVSAPSQQEQASMPHMTYGERDLGPAGPDLQLGGRVPTPLQQKRMGGRGTFGGPSTERAGTHHRKGMNYGELNAAEIDRGLKVDWDPAAGRPRSVTFRIDPEVARLSYEDPKRRFIPDRSTEGLQPSDDAYRNSGYDHFHLAQREAFKGSVETERSADLMTAVVPATERLNRGPGSPWRAAEAADVKLAARTGSPLTVVVEPIYDLNPLRLRDGTPVPARIRRVTMDAAGRTIRDQTFENR